ncbi:MAG TPA: hypothetical protein VK507_10475 [Iamia sp.]|nr:hypothetical protein [Iamia sp.]
MAGRDGDLSVTFTITTDPAGPGVVTVRVQLDDPTGTHATDGYPYGPWGMIDRIGSDDPAGPDHARWGDSLAGCGPDDGGLSGPAGNVTPGAHDETFELIMPSGPQRLSLQAMTLFCMDEGDWVDLEHAVVVP